MGQGDHALGVAGEDGLLELPQQALHQRHHHSGVVVSGRGVARDELQAAPVAVLGGPEPRAQRPIDVEGELLVALHEYREALDQLVADPVELGAVGFKASA